MTAPQPTHDPVHEANLQERERGQLELIKGLRESNRALTAEVLKLREDIASNETLRMVNSANEELSKYISVIEANLNAVTSERDECRKDIAEAAGELMVDMATAPPGSDTARLILANVAMRRERDASWKAKQKADRELVELRERAEGAEARCRVASIRLRDTIEGRNDGPTNLEEYVERAITHIRDLDSLLNKALADNEGWKRRCHDELEPERDELRDKLAAAEARAKVLESDLRDMTDRYHDASGEADRLHDRINHAGAYARVKATTPAEQPGRAEEEPVECKACQDVEHKYRMLLVEVGVLRDCFRLSRVGSDEAIKWAHDGLDRIKKIEDDVSPCPRTVDR